MEESFIPKNISPHPARSRESLGIFVVLGIVVFAIAILSLVGLILYKKNMTSQVDRVVSELERQEADFKKYTIEEWARTAEGLHVAKGALDQHRYLSGAFSFLEARTLATVRFSKFAFDAADNKVTLAAEAKSYAALAQQKDILEKDPAVAKFAIGKFSLTPGGGVNAVVEIIFNPSLFAGQ